MSLERSTAGTGIGAEPAPTHRPGATEGATDEPSAAMRLQVLSAEHWSLLASRSLAWNETFSRAGMFLSLVSGAVVALALVAQASEFGEGFRLFALVILPVVLFAGIGTWIRQGRSNYHDAMCVVGMNRIRAGYLELVPDAKRFFVMGTTDDERGVNLTMAAEPGASFFADLLASTPTLVTVVNSVLFAAIGSLLALQFGAGALPALLIGIVAFVISLGFQFWIAAQSIVKAIAAYQPNPSAEGEQPQGL